MKITPEKYFEVGKNIVHCIAPLGSDYALCGFSLDGDQAEVKLVCGVKITCGQCLDVIKFCKSISGFSF